MEFYKNLIQDLSAKNVKLVAVSKTKPNHLISDLYDLGQRVFGENRVQEMVEKHDALPKDIEWHMIGHLQKNKVKYIAPFVSMIHSVDNLKLAEVINKEAQKHKRKIEILLQLKIAEEDSKSGFELENLKLVLPQLIQLESVVIRGLMGMGTFTDDHTITRKEFTFLRQTFEELRRTFDLPPDTFNEVSMGMSGDYKIAIAAGSTMVRIGSLLFGSRN